MICPSSTRTDRLVAGEVGGRQLPELGVVVLADHRPVAFGDRVRPRHDGLVVLVEDRVAVVVEDGFLGQLDAGGPTSWSADDIPR